MEPPPGAAENSKLRHVEKDVLIPQIMREKAKELCSDQVQGNCGECTGSMEIPSVIIVGLANSNENFFFYISVINTKIDRNLNNGICFESSDAGESIAFTKCCKETGFLMVVKCRPENTALKDCLVSYYRDPAFYEECKAEYLKQREEYRATGIKKIKKKLPSNV